MAVTQVYEIDGVTIGSTEISIVSGTTTLQNIADAGVYQLWVDCANMAKGDIYIIRAYEKVENTGGTKRVAFTAYLQGAQSELFITPPIALMYAWDFTLQKSAGTDRAFDASIRKIG